MVYQNNAVTKYVSNTRGSVLLPMLILGGVISVTAVTVLFSYQSRQKIQARAQAREDLNNLTMNLKMLFSSRDACKVNLTGAGFGQTVAELNGKSAAKAVQVIYKGIGGANQTMVTPGKHSDRLVIKEAYFSKFTAVDTPIPTNGVTTYLGNLTITLADNYAVPMREIVLPFYFTESDTKVLTDCFATSYPNGVDTDLAMEDLLCQQIRDPDYYYSPREHGCIKNPVVIGSR